jgi:3'(2'), 5'-bisphosphate nucleotidase
LRRDPGILLEKLVAMALEAGRAVLDIYGSDFGVSYKSDSSPLTEADRRSHRIISARLAEAAPEVPVLSEEGKGVPYESRRGWRSFFLVDPLDGTKEFVNRNGEFTVNIALIEEGRPVMGVVHVPVGGATYYAARGLGAYRLGEGGEAGRIAVREAPEEGLVAVASRSHASPGLEEFLGGLRVRERVSRGSSLKFCLVAEGGADIYPRLGPTWEWDTGAGHAVVEEAGGSVTDLAGSPLAYNKESLKHEGFVVIGDPGIRAMMEGLSGGRSAG